MADDDETWKPGSFTKNFSWESQRGFVQLHESIRIGFDNKLEDVPRDKFRERIADRGRPDYIPINFFLFNRMKNGRVEIVVDELVFQALTAPHSVRFDKLALFAFHLSYVGKFERASPAQRHPAAWAHDYVKTRLAADFKWDTSKVTADDFEKFLQSNPRYRAKTARKVATNVMHLYRIGRLRDTAIQRVERWWVDALFLTLDRVIEDRRLDRLPTPNSQLPAFLEQADFIAISGPQSLEKNLAAAHLVRLYAACGGRERFSDDAVRKRTMVRIKDLEQFINPNDDAPIGAVHPTNSRILKSIPALCAMLALYAGFDIVSALHLEDFDPDNFSRQGTRKALEELKEAGIEPTISVEELLRLTRNG